MIALSIAGFDPSGGAGILADIKTFHSLGVYGTAAITALTVQNVKRVVEIKGVEPEFLSKQIDIIIEAENIQYAKTGMLYSPEIVKIIASKVNEHNLKLIVDPVLVAGSGGTLSVENLAESIKKYLLPIADLTTPNIYEASVLSGIEIENEDDAVDAAQVLGKICPVVVTGGHLNGCDIFFDGSLNFIDGEIIHSPNTHGSGCTYSAAVTAYQTKGLSMLESIKKAADFTKNAIKNGQYGTLSQLEYK